MKLILVIHITTPVPYGSSGSICMFTDSKVIDLHAKDIIDIVTHGSIQIQDRFYKIRDLTQLQEDTLSASSFQELPKEEHTLENYKNLKAQGLLVNASSKDAERIRRRGYADLRPEEF